MESVEQSLEFTIKAEEKKYWGDAAKDLLWFKNPKKVLKIKQDLEYQKFEWFAGGTTNLSYNCLDRHINSIGDKDAIIFQGDREDNVRKITYKELHRDVCDFSKVLKDQNVKKGDVVVIYMPNIPEAIIAMLATSRIGAVHNVVFSGFSPEALMNRIVNSRAKMILTTDSSVRGGRVFPLKSLVDKALDMISDTASDSIINKNFKVIVFNSSQNSDNSSKINMKPGRDIDWVKAIQDSNYSNTYANTKELLANQAEKTSNQLILDQTNQEIVNQEIVNQQILTKKETEQQTLERKKQIEELNSEDPAFILYTSGTTGTPKGLLHTVGGYMVHINQTFKEMFDPRPDDKYWCTADVGWITGHSYLVYAPLLNGITSVIFEGIPTYPAPDRYWKTIEKLGVNIFYTSPTALRILKGFGDEIPNKYNLNSIRVLGSVGEPINREAWEWFFHKIGKDRCPIIDTWWQTETGGIIIAPRYSDEIKKMSFLKPGSATKPLPGLSVDVLDENGDRISEPNESGYLVINKPWPGMARTIYGDHDRYVKTYWSKFPGKYFTGDGAFRDKDGDFHITGRIDDEIKVSGHRIGTAEVESVVCSCENIIEAAVVGIKHKIKGNALCVFAVLKVGESENIKKKILETVASRISAIARPDYVYFVDALPKTRSGKIMRRVLSAIAERSNDFGDKRSYDFGDNFGDNLGDISTAANPETINDIIKKINKTI